jgi:hypothetical protein
VKNFASFPEVAIAVTPVVVENRLSFYRISTLVVPSTFGRVTLFRGHGDDNDNNDSTTIMSADAILGTYARSARVWFPDKEQGWISAEVTQASKGTGDRVKLQFIDERGKVHIHSYWLAFRSWSVALTNGGAGARPALFIGNIPQCGAS